MGVGVGGGSRWRCVGTLGWDVVGDWVDQVDHEDRGKDGEAREAPWTHHNGIDGGSSISPVDIKSEV